MISRLSRRVYTCAFAIAMIAGHALSASAADPTIKVAFWNIMSGKGVDALAGTRRAVPQRHQLHGPLAAAERLGRRRVAGRAAQDRQPIRRSSRSASPNPGATSAARRRTSGRRSAGRPAPASRTASRSSRATASPVRSSGSSSTRSLNTTPGRHDVGPARARSASTRRARSRCPSTSRTGTAPAPTARRATPRRRSRRCRFSPRRPTACRTSSSATSTCGKAPPTVCNQNPTNSALPYLRGAGYLDAWLTIQGSTRRLHRHGQPRRLRLSRRQCVEAHRLRVDAAGLPAARHSALRGDAGRRRLPLRPLRHRRHAAEPVSGPRRRRPHRLQRRRPLLLRAGARSCSGAGARTAPAPRAGRPHVVDVPRQGGRDRRDAAEDVRLR